MDRLWAPWRARYILSSTEKSANPEPCFICSAIRSDPSSDRENLLAWRGDSAVVMLNRYPYNNGHLLIAPRVHKGTLTELETSELIEPVEVVRWMVDVLTGMLKPQGFNVGLNLGKSAGAGLPGHLHWHVVPRWDGDTNFMPVLGDVRCIVESLDEFHVRLSERIRLQPFRR